MGKALYSEQGSWKAVQLGEPRIKQSNYLKI